MELRAEKKSELKANNQLKNSRTSSKLNPNKVRKDVISTGRNQCDNGKQLIGRKIFVKVELWIFYLYNIYYKKFYQNIISDDYGFESNASDSIYDKLMKKYEANPEVCTK